MSEEVWQVWVGRSSACASTCVGVCASAYWVCLILHVFGWITWTTGVSQVLISACPSSPAFSPSSRLGNLGAPTLVL